MNVTCRLLAKPIQMCLNIPYFYFSIMNFPTSIFDLATRSSCLLCTTNSFQELSVQTLLLQDWYNFLSYHSYTICLSDFFLS